MNAESAPLSVERSSAATGLAALDYSVLQQCMHCGLCLPTCPTFVETGRERNSPRGRIALMRAVADGELALGRAFGEEMYYCLGCLACTTACPAGVDYATLFETARAEIEDRGVLAGPKRSFIRAAVLRLLFTRPRLLRLAGRLLWLYETSGLQTTARRLGLTRLLPGRLRGLEPQTPRVQRRFSHQLIAPVEPPAGPRRHRVAVLTGCVQDLVFSDINRATVDVLQENGCEVHTPPVQPCCGSLHAHNGDLGSACDLARRLIDLLPADAFDAIITNAGGCGSHLRRFGHLLAGDPDYAARAAAWSAKIRDIHEFLVAIGFRQPRPHSPEPEPTARTVTYHESCHLCHGQKISREPREVLASLPGVELRECAESAWCCGSAGIYNITQPATAAWLQGRKLDHLAATGAAVIATANPGCHLQLENGLRARGGPPARVAHPVVLLAEAYRAERTSNGRNQVAPPPS
ncbi:MAG TPA: (Fe-S)-binding protein [Opitutaceae bacterium]|nr:(Fe-S)-binding protein [Opitutaceae bacterium]